MKDDKKASGIEVYGTGVVNCSVCAPSWMSAEVVINEVERVCAAGTENGWDITEEEFATGEPNPFPCNSKYCYRSEEDRKHWLLTC